MFTRILVPTDFSKPSDAALAHARRLASNTGATIHLLHVVDNLFLRAVLGDPHDYEAAALRQLQDREAAHAEDISSILAVERSDEPADEITSYARTHGIDMIVMGTHGRGRMAHLLLGSVAARVARTAPCPVLTMPRRTSWRPERNSHPRADRLQLFRGRGAGVRPAAGSKAARFDPPAARRRSSRNRRVIRIRTVRS